MDKLASVHFFRRVPKDMTESTAHGGVVSIVGAVLMVLLFLNELSSYMTIDTSSKIVMDQNTGRQWAIEFNVTMAHIPCKYASVDIADLHGMVQHNLTLNIERWHVDENFEPYVEHVATERKVEYEEIDHPEFDHEDENPVQELKTDLWNDQMHQFPVVMVNFHAPWCMWCRRLAPVWEHAALKSAEKFGDEVMFGKVDCTHRDAVQICRDNRIMAFPTIRVYKDGKTISHQDYDGDRSVDALVNYVQHQRWATDEEFNKQQMAKAEIAKVTSPESFTGERARGCRINGHVTIGRAPGSMRITPADPGSSFLNDKINVSHLVHHLSFGDVKAAHTKHGVKHGSLHPEKAHYALEGAKFSALSGSVHVTHQNVTQEHYLKVVRTEVRRNGVQLPLSASYQYTVTNAQFAEAQESPSAKFSFDLSPMQVMVMEETRSFGHFITSVCAIIGGVFTMIGIFDSVLHHSVRAIEHKMNLNKQS